MATSTTDTFEINGVIDTSQRVFDNLQRLCNSAGAFFTYDVSQGKYAVVVNTTGTSVATFDESNIIGGIQLSTLDVNEMYNAASVEYNHKDIRDGTDTMNLILDAEDQHTPNEIKNTLNLKYDLVNNPIQAAYLAKLQIQQSRFDKIIQFRTDYSHQGLRAGNVIQIVNDWLGYPLTGNPTTLGYFRISSIKEIDDAENGFLLEITAFEYSDTVYTKNNLYRDIRDQKTGIKSRRENACLEKKDDQKIGDDINKAFTPGTDVNDAIKSGAPNGAAASGFVPELAKRKFTVTGPSQVCEGQTGVAFTFTAPLDCCVTNDYTVPYTITGIQTDDISIPLTGNITFTAGVGTLTMDIDNAADTEGDETMVIQVGCTTHSVLIKDTYLDAPVYTITPSAATVSECDTLTFTVSATNTDNGASIPYTITGIDAGDLLTGSLTGNIVADWCDEDGTVELTFTKGTNEGTEVITFTLDGKGVSTTVNLTDAVNYTVAWATSTITEGDSTSFTITVDGIPDGVSVPWALSGSALSKVSSATSGSVSISGGLGTVNVTTNDDGTDDGYSTTLIATAGPTTGYETCGSATANLEVLDNDGSSVEFANCQYTLVPLAWCPVYQNSDGEVTNLTIKKYMSALTYPRTGTPVVVPASVTVTKGNPSTVTVNSTITVYTNSSYAGVDCNVITSFNSIAVDDMVTGTTTSVRGFM
jgi:hypothetical protein